MSSPRPVILFEPNECTPKLMFRFIEEGHLPNFKRFHDEARVFTSDAQEEGMNLNPWIQWVTIHSGLTREEHGIHDLGEGGQLATKGIIDLASDAGLRVWMCLSMNIRPHTPLNGAMLPDPWCTDAAPYPSDLEPFFRFIHHHVLEHTHPDSQLGLGDNLAFLRFVATHGLSAQTLGSICAQLVRERSGRFGWKRIGILEQVAWDVFRWQYEKLSPHLATLFLPSVAHLTHTHWRNLEPELYSVQPTAEEQDEYSDAVLFAYQSQDRVLGQLLDLAGDEATIILCSALGLQPDLNWEGEGGKHFYRPRDFETLTTFAGISDPHRCSPVMSEEFWIEFSDEAAAARAEICMSALKMDGESAFRAERKGSYVYSGCSVHKKIQEDAKLVNSETGSTAGFLDLLYAADSLKSSNHHPDALLWVRSPDCVHHVQEEKVPLTTVAPTVLKLLGLDVPDHMKGSPLI